MMHSPPAKPPKGFFALGVFFFFGSAMAAFASITLLWPGTLLDRAWALNPSAHAQMLPLGRIAGIPSLVLSIVLLLAGMGGSGGTIGVGY
jgi:hypothetical protein